MSNTWHCTAETSLANVGQSETAKLLVTLAKRNPALARVFAQVNWLELVKGCVREALKSVAKGRPWTYSEDSFAKAKGEVIGMVMQGQFVLGYSDNNGAITEFIRSYDDHQHSLDGAKALFDAAFKEELVKSVLKLSGFKMARTVSSDGTPVVVAVKENA